MSQYVPDPKTPPFIGRYHEAIGRLHEEGLVPFSPLESVMVGVIVGWMNNERRDKFPGIGDRLVYEVDNCNVPKYVALISWLSPFGACSQDPDLVWRLAQYLLGYTKVEEESRLPGAVRRELQV